MVMEVSNCGTKKIIEVIIQWCKEETVKLHAVVKVCT
jgi:hypothetical protein